MVSTLELQSSNKIILWVGFTITRGTVLKGHSIKKIENHWARASFGNLLSPGSECQLILHYEYAIASKKKEGNSNCAMFCPRSHNKPAKPYP